MFIKKPITLAVIASLTSGSLFAEEAASSDYSNSEQVEELIVVASKKTTFANQATTESMKDQQNPISSVLAVVDNLPGVNITEGDSFGFDDWSTTINVRGFQTSLSEQQVGITIDGLPNGESNYGGGSKANRFIDSANMARVEVSQGTADVSSRSLEALGGTLNFVTRDPRDEAGAEFVFSTGSHDALRYGASYDTGLIFNDSTRAFVSAYHQEASDWIGGTAENDKNHFAAKFISDFGNTRLTGYLSHDDVHEDNYQRITVAEFAANPNSDRLTGEWTGIPYVDQVHRQSWSTLRENTFAYLKLEHELESGLKIGGAIYNHANKGRGDWVPPYLVDINNDQGGPQTEFTSNTTALGGSPLGSIYFVDAQGNALAPIEGCVSSITQPYGGSGPESDPSCYQAGAIGVQSYRHTHYQKDRFGATADFSYDMEIGEYNNTLRGGIWYEDQTREEYRDWHRISDTSVGPSFEETPYWIQYDREYPREVVNYYLDNKLEIGSVTASVGIRQFLVTVERNDNFNASLSTKLESDSDVLFSGGLRWDTPVDGLEVFAGYAENFRALNDLILEREAVIGANIEPETSQNIELGLRYDGTNFNGSAVYFDNQFENRLEFFGAQLAGNIPNFLIGTDGRYENVGGVDTTGFELSGTYIVNDSLNIYSAYTYLNSTYIGTGLGAAANEALSVFPGNEVVNTPSSSLVVSADWTTDAYRVGISAKYAGDRYVDRANTLVAEGYTTADVYFGFSGDTISDQLSDFDFNLVINNVFDESYLGGISGFGAWIGSPRTTVLSVTAKF